MTASYPGSAPAGDDGDEVPGDGADVTADVVIIGDGPAGSALARACHLVGVEALLVGDDADWSATYSTWTDDLADPAAIELVDVDAVVATVSTEVWAYGARSHQLRRAYATFDNVKRAEHRAQVRLSMRACQACLLQSTWTTQDQ